MKKALLCGVSLLLCIGLITGCDNASKKTEPGIVENTDPIPATGISLSVGRTEYSNGSSYTLGIGEDNGRYIYANLEPADSTSYVYWETSDTSLLNIEVFPNTHSIFLTALYDEDSWSESEASKNATLTATTEEGYSASLNIIVNKPLGTSTTKTNTTIRVFFTNSGHTTYYALPDYTGQDEEWPGCKEDCFTSTTGSLTYWWYDEETGDWPTITGKTLTEGINEADNIVYYDTVIDELEVGIDYGALVALKFNSSITTEFNTNDYSFSVSQYDVADENGVIELYVTQNPANIIQPFAPVDMTLHIYFEDSAGTTYALPDYAVAYLSGDFTGSTWSYSESTKLTAAGTTENPYYTITLYDMAVVEDMEFAVYLEYTGWTSPTWLKYYGNFAQTPTSGVVDVHLPGGDPADTIHDPNATAHIKIELVNTGTSLTAAGSYTIAGWAGSWTSTYAMSHTDNDTYYYEGDIVAYNDFEFTIIYNSSTWQRVIFEPSEEDSGNYWFDNDNNTFITGEFFEQDHSYVFKLEADLASWNGTSNLTASSYSFTDATAEAVEP